MSNKTNEEIENLEKQLELLKQKQQIEDENKQLKEDVAYLRQSKELQEKGEGIAARGIMGCLGLQGLGCLGIIIIFVFGAIFS